MGVFRNDCYDERELPPRRSIQSFVVATTCAALSACSLFTDFDVLGGVSEAADAQSQDLPDSSVPRDAEIADATSPDASTDATTPVGHACTATSLLCDDFERTTAQGPWDVVQGALATSTTKAHGGQRSLAASFDSAQALPSLSRNFTGAAPRVRFSVAINADATPASGSYEILKIVYGPTNNWESAVVNLDAQGIKLALGRYDNTSGPTEMEKVTLANAPLFFGTGFHVVEVTLDVGASPLTASASIDGAEPKTVTLATTHPTPTALTLGIGVTYVMDTTTPYEVDFDDVVVDPL